MRQRGLWVGGAAVLVAVVATAAVAADDGATLFKKACGTCHALTPADGPRQGPPLAGVYGRAAGTVAGFKYSPVLQDAGFAWDAAALDAWITNPAAVRPGTTMLYRQRDAAKRLVLVNYLRSLSPAAAAGATPSQ
jgi:cytochrome c